MDIKCTFSMFQPTFDCDQENSILRYQSTILSTLSLLKKRVSSC